MITCIDCKWWYGYCDFIDKNKGAISALILPAIEDYIEQHEPKRKRCKLYEHGCDE